MWLEVILCEFGQICATGNALVQLETIFYASLTDLCDRKALMQLETILCK